MDSLAEKDGIAPGAPVLVGRTEAEWEGRPLPFFGGNDYHRFATHPEVIAALCAGARRHGISSAGSRVTTANHRLYGELEVRLAAFLGVEEVVLCATGYLSNLAAIQGGGVEFERVLLEGSAHTSLSEAARLSGLPLRLFRSRDPEALAAELRREPGPALILCEGVAPSTGHLGPLAEYASLAAEAGGALVVDDAHGIGTLGASGRGSPEEAGLPPGTVVQAGTLSKAFGCYGGLVAASPAWCGRIRARSAAYSGATPIPLAVAAAALRALRLLEEEPDRIALLRDRSLKVKARMRGAGYPVSEGPAPICSLTFPREDAAAAFRSRMVEGGVYPVFIRYPGAPPGGHCRLTLSSEHTEDQMAALTGLF